MLLYILSPASQLSESTSPAHLPRSPPAAHLPVVIPPTLSPPAQLSPPLRVLSPVTFFLLYLIYLLSFFRVVFLFWFWFLFCFIFFFFPSLLPRQPHLLLFSCSWFPSPSSCFLVLFLRSFFPPPLYTFYFSLKPYFYSVSSSFFIILFLCFILYFSSSLTLAASETRWREM